MGRPEVSRIEWGTELRVGLGDTLRDDGEAIAADVIEGRATGWRIDGGRAYLVVRMEQYGTRRECVVVAARGRGLLDVTPVIFDAARAAGCARVRWHTQRPGLARLVAKQHDVTEIERVYSVEIAQ